MAWRGVALAARQRATLRRSQRYNAGESSHCLLAAAESYS